MKRLAGQAGRTLGGFVHALGMFVITLFLVLAGLLGGLAYRLSQGPVQIPWITTLLANAVSGEDVDIDVGQAALGWAGYKKGGGEPLYLQLGRITVHNPGGVQLAAIPDATLALTPSEIFSRSAAIYVTSTDARFAGANVPVSLLAGIHLGRGFKLAEADLWVTLGPGAMGPPGLAVPLASGKFFLKLTAKNASLTDGQFMLTPIGGSAPVLRIAGTAHRDSFWHGTLNLTGNSVQAQDLAHYWPVQLVPQTRTWITTNIIAGTAEAPNFTFALSAPGHLSNLRLDNAAGSFKANDLTLTWLPGARPITGLNGTLTLTDPDDIDIAANGTLGGNVFTGASMHIAGVSERNQTGTLHIPISGSIPSALAVLGAPPLNLLKTVPQPLLGATGDMTGAIDVMLPFKNDLTIGEVRLKVSTALTNVTIPLPVEGLTLRQGVFTLVATTQSLDAGGKARFGGENARLKGSANFAGAGSAGFEMDTAMSGKTLTRLGLNPGGTLIGRMPLDIRFATRPPNPGSLTITADLRPATLSLPIFGWTKAAGKPGAIDFAASIEGQNFSGISKIVSIDAQAPGLDIESQASAGGINLSRIHIGNTEGAGRIALPATEHAPWRFDFFGNMLDASALNPPRSAKPATAAPNSSAGSQSPPPSGILWRATVHFDHVLLAQAPAPQLGDVDFDGDGEGNSIFDGTATGMLVSGQPVNLAIASSPGQPAGAREQLHLVSGDGGELLRALGAYSQLGGGQLDFDASYGTAIPLSGTTTLTDFRLLKAPAVAKLLEAITVFGIPDAASGPGLQFRKLIAPFSVAGGMMTLQDARAYSASLGFTASGTIDLNAGIYDIQGTVVPAYALNALPGKIPLIGRLFSPEKGGGLFAMRYSMTGSTADPKIKVNPVSVLTPGFLRGIFGLGHELETK
jgi:hypothetical protein